MWENPDNSRDFIYTNCYKVVAQDPYDEVVEDVCSLKTGVSLAILKQELDNRQFQKALKQVYQRSINIGQYYHILNKNETILLFESLQEIFY